MKFNMNNPNEIFQKQFIIHCTVFVDINMREYFFSNDVTLVATKYI